METTIWVHRCEQGIYQALPTCTCTFTVEYQSHKNQHIITEITNIWLDVGSHGTLDFANKSVA